MRLQCAKAGEIGVSKLGGSDLAGKKGMANGENLGMEGLGSGGGGNLIGESGIGDGVRR